MLRARVASSKPPQLRVHDRSGGADQSPKRQRGVFTDSPKVFGPARLRSGLGFGARQVRYHAPLGSLASRLNCHGPHNCRPIRIIGRCWCRFGPVFGLLV